MSDTPRTDAELRKPIHDTGIYNNLTEFCQELERELSHMEALIHQGDMLMAELLRDTERLDWLLNRAFTIQIREGDIGKGAKFGCVRLNSHGSA